MHDAWVYYFTPLKDTILNIYMANLELYIGKMYIRKYNSIIIIV